MEQNDKCCLESRCTRKSCISEELFEGREGCPCFDCALEVVPPLGNKIKKIVWIAVPAQAALPDDANVRNALEQG